jgi:hypothetical protein
MNIRREYGLTLIILLVAAIGVIIAYGASWVTATVPVFRGEPTPTRLVSLTGSMLVGWAAAAGWVAAACAAGIVATRGWGRVIIGMVAALAGLAAGIGAVTFILSRGPLVATALADDQVIAVAGNAWWVIAGICGLAVTVSGAVTVLHGRRWPTLSARYERTPQAATGDSSSAMHMWDALDRGDDPTDAGSGQR